MENRGQGYAVNRKRVMHLMRKMGLEGQAPGPSTSRPHPEHKVYPYLLRGLEITSVNQVWRTDITYIPLKQGYMVLAAVMDWHSRYVLFNLRAMILRAGFWTARYASAWIVEVVHWTTFLSSIYGEA